MDTRARAALPGLVQREKTRDAPLLHPALARPPRPPAPGRAAAGHRIHRPGGRRRRYLTLRVPRRSPATDPASRRRPDSSAHLRLGVHRGSGRAPDSRRAMPSTRAEGQARCKASPAPPGWPSALNPSWKATVPCGVCPSKDSAKKTSGGTPSCTSPDMFLNPNFL